MTETPDADVGADVVDLAARRPAGDDHRHCGGCGGVWWLLGPRGAVVIDQADGRVVGYSATDNNVRCIDCGRKEGVWR